MIGGVAVILLAVLLYWLFSGGSVSVTDSYVKARRVALSTDVSGLVTKVAVHDHQQVSKGQVLFELDPAQFAIAVSQARANLAEAVQKIDGAKQSYAAQIAKIDAQKAVVANDRINFRSYQALIGNGGVTRTAYNNAKYKLEMDEASLEAMTAQASVDLAQLSGDPHIAVAKTPQYQRARAALDLAELNAHHAIVRAPFAGVVTETAKLQPGMFLPAGTAAFALVSSTDVWVRTQPKETQLTWVRPGDKVRIHVDTYPGRVWHGVVGSISPASGSSFSILPAQNSSGNWVKVVQRIPVHIKIISGPKNLPLRNGMSAEITILTGHQRSLSQLF
jgi:membrane fusion protein (multidrug efflux system)